MEVTTSHVLLGVCQFYTSQCCYCPSNSIVIGTPYHLDLVYTVPGTSPYHLDLVYTVPGTSPYHLDLEYTQVQFTLLAHIHTHSCRSKLPTIPMSRGKYLLSLHWPRDQVASYPGHTLQLFSQPWKRNW